VAVAAAAAAIQVKRLKTVLRHLRLRIRALRLQASRLPRLLRCRRPWLRPVQRLRMRMRMRLRLLLKPHQLKRTLSLRFSRRRKTRQHRQMSR
jgi:hypothetical protein